MDNNGHSLSSNIAADRNPLYADEYLDSEETWSMEEDLSLDDLGEFLAEDCEQDGCAGCYNCMPNADYEFMDDEYWQALAHAMLDSSTPSPPEDNNSLECPSAPSKPSFNVWTNSWDYPSSPTPIVRTNASANLAVSSEIAIPMERRVAKRPRPDPEGFPPEEPIIMKIRRIE